MYFVLAFSFYLNVVFILSFVSFPVFFSLYFGVLPHPFLIFVMNLVLSLIIFSCLPNQTKI